MSSENQTRHPLLIGMENDTDYYDNCTSEFDQNCFRTNCTNEYCIPDTEYIDLMNNHIYPKIYEWVLICLFGVIFIVGLVGNFLVCVAVYRNPIMRTVTNYFIVNLALADFMVVLLCLPPTVVWDVTETWFLGNELCKVVLYFQTVSVAVSVLTLTFISIDRWYAICYPLRFRSTTGRAKTAIIAIWLVSLVIDIPELVWLQTKSRDNLRVETNLFIECIATWDFTSEIAYNVVKAVCLYTLPLIFMSFAYFHIIRVLWRSDIPGNRRNASYNHVSNLSTLHSNSTCRGNSTLSTSPGNPSSATGASNGSQEGPLRSRRKAAKMLVVVVIMFAVCYFPVHLLSILRYTIGIPQNEFTECLSMISHWLCYANSAMNPVIYNFMSGKFQREFKRAFQCVCLYGDYYPASARVHTSNTIVLSSRSNRQSQVYRLPAVKQHNSRM